MGQVINGLALCAGAAGLELGVAAALGEHYRAIAYVERAAEAACLLADHMAASLLAPAPIWDDVKTFDGKPWRGVVDIVTAGFPCQPFSVAGLRRGHEDERHLWPHIARIIGECQPGIVFLENVPGLLTTGTPDGRYAYEHVEGDLRALGFQVAAGIFSAAEVGAPHQRERLFILAVADGRCEHVNVQQRPARRELTGSRAELGHSRHGAGCAEQRGQCEVTASIAGQAGGTVGDADQPGLERRVRSERQCGDKRIAWPPGPQDTDAWAAVLRERPDLAPAVADTKNGKSRQVGIAPRFSDAYSITAQPGIRNLADELPGQVAGLPRVARLRILGNAVVAATAHKAFCTLWRELN